MTPKEKAHGLIVKALVEFEKLTISEAKKIALIAVDEILDLDLHDVGDYRNDQSSPNDFSTVTWYINYWEEVKQEIEKL